MHEGSRANDSLSGVSTMFWFGSKERIRRAITKLDSTLLPFRIFFLNESVVAQLAHLTSYISPSLSRLKRLTMSKNIPRNTATVAMHTTTAGKRKKRKKTRWTYAKMSLKKHKHISSRSVAFRNGRMYVCVIVPCMCVSVYVCVFWKIEVEVVRHSVFIWFVVP